jgi:hypothetical protein
MAVVSGAGHYTFKALVVGRYEGLFTQRSPTGFELPPSEVIFLDGKALEKYDFFG